MDCYGSSSANIDSLTGSTGPHGNCTNDSSSLEAGKSIQEVKATSSIPKGKMSHISMLHNRKWHGSEQESEC
jgi:hypothetical protein